MKKYLLIFSLAFIFSVNAQTITTIAGTGTCGFSGNGGLATNAQVNYTKGVTYDNFGNVYFSDTYNNVVRKITTSGTITTVAGTGVQGYSGDGSLGTSAQLYRPFGLALDASGNLFIADCFNHVVRKLNTAGIITTAAGIGTPGFSGDGGLAASAMLSGPSAVAFDPGGNLYIADYTNNRIRMVNTSSIISTFAGNGSGSFSGDGGQATAASMWIPTGVGADGAGNVYICDHNNSRIRVVNTSGTITTIAGNGTFGYGGDGGPAILGIFNGAEQIAVDPAGNIYIAESGGCRVRKITVSPTAINDITIKNKISIYPNPGNGIFYFSAEKPQEGFIEVYNSLGQKILSEQMNNNAENKIDITSFDNGIYYLRLNTSNAPVISSKIIKH